MKTWILSWALVPVLGLAAPSAWAATAGDTPAVAGSPTTLRGLFRYGADAADFTDCASGQRWPVAMEGGYLDLERAYAAIPKASFEPVMAVVEGRVALRPPMEGPGPVPTLLVDRFLRLEPGAQCPTGVETMPLEDTYWKLVAFGDEPVSPPPGRDVPYLILRAAERSAVGSNGCNRFLGGYTLDGEGVAFAPAATTRMACPGAEELAGRFNRAVLSAVRWRVAGAQLELFDAEGRPVVRFQGEATK